MDVSAIDEGVAVQTGSLPHGGELVERRLEGVEAESARARAARLPQVPLTEVARSDLRLIGDGAFSPLTGFQGKADYESILETWRLANGIVWSIPIVLSVPDDHVAAVSRASEIALTWAGEIVGILRVAEVFERDPEREAALVYKTTEIAHPGVARVYGEPRTLVAGPVWAFDPPESVPHAADYLSPRQLRDGFAERGWRQIVAFQTRNPIHRAHEHIQKTALEMVDGLLVHPLVGETKSDDVPADIRLSSYRTLLDNYYPASRVMLSVYPAAMRYAGPREAIFHALARKNYGCTHFIVGRDHAGVGSYYGTYEAQQAFDRFTDSELGITPLRFDHTFYCRRCDGMVSTKTCPHDATEHVTLSGTRVREMLSNGDLLPPEISRPEVARVLMQAYVNGSNGAAQGGAI